MLPNLARRAGKPQAQEFCIMSPYSEGDTLMFIAGYLPRTEEDEVRSTAEVASSQGLPGT